MPVIFGDDGEDLAGLGLEPDALEQLARMGIVTDAVKQFQRFDIRTRDLVMRLCDNPCDADIEELISHPIGPWLARWIMTLPMVAAGDEIDVVW